MKKTFQKIKKLVKQSRTALVAAHIDPDGDTLGSMIAFSLILEKMGLQVVRYSHDGVPRTYHFLPRSREIVTRVPQRDFDLLITVDCSDLSRIGGPVIRSRKIINIDHHPDNTRFGDINCVKMLSSVAEQIFELAKFLQIKLTQDIAEALYVAIITDTGNFRFSDTLASTFEVAKELVKAGANPWKLSTMVYDTKTIAGMKVLARALEKMQLSKDKKILWSEVDEAMIKKTGAAVEEMVGIIDYLRSVAGPEVFICMREDNGRVKINFRSKGQVNVSEIAQELGGGGHRQASGCVLSGTIHQVRDRVLKIVHRHVK